MLEEVLESSEREVDISIIPQYEIENGRGSYIINYMDSYTSYQHFLISI